MEVLLSVTDIIVKYADYKTIGKLRATSRAFRNSYKEYWVDMNLMKKYLKNGTKIIPHIWDSLIVKTGKDMAPWANGKHFTNKSLHESICFLKNKREQIIHIDLKNFIISLGSGNEPDKSGIYNPELYISHIGNIPVWV
jgi:hypothetical protein